MRKTHIYERHFRSLRESIRKSLEFVLLREEPFHQLNVLRDLQFHITLSLTYTRWLILINPLEFFGAVKFKTKKFQTKVAQLLGGKKMVILINL